MQIPMPTPRALRRPPLAGASPACAFRAALALLLLAGLLAPPAGAALRVVSAERLLAEATVEVGGRLWLVTPRGTELPLLTDPEDPAVSNPGDGRFHPAPAEWVADAVSELDASFASELEGTIWILPYPIAGRLRSYTEAGVVYLSPGTVAMSRQQVHFLVAHEVGHLLHQAFLPDADSAGWAAYRRLRGIQDEGRYHQGAPHPDRPHEIFAEDFRLLFGGPLARSVPQENQELVPAGQVPGLEAFLRGLLTRSPAAVAWRAGPNPLERGQELRLAGLPPGNHPWVLYDARGRRRAAGEMSVGASGEAAWSWRPEGPLPAGIYFLRVSAPGDGRVLRLTLVD
jgi:hypothetical protein